MPTDELKLGEKVPNTPEAGAVGPATTKITRNSAEFQKLVKNLNPDIVFKDEEHDSSDRMMTVTLKAGLDRLAALVKTEWPTLKLRVTEAWDDRSEHGPNSIHYEARAADLTTSDLDRAKYGRLARLAVDAGIGWVFYENAQHVHVSVKKDA